MCILKKDKNYPDVKKKFKAYIDAIAVSRADRRDITSQKDTIISGLEYLNEALLFFPAFDIYFCKYENPKHLTPFNKKCLAVQELQTKIIPYKYSEKSIDAIYKIGKYLLEINSKYFEDFTIKVQQTLPKIIKYIEWKNIFGVKTYAENNQIKIEIYYFDKKNNYAPTKKIFSLNRSKIKSKYFDANIIEEFTSNNDEKLFLNKNGKFAIKYLLQEQVFNFKHHLNIFQYINNRIKLKLNDDFDVDDLIIKTHSVKLNYQQLKNNDFHLDSGTYTFEIDNGWFGTDYCFKPNEKFLNGCNTSFSKDECEKVTFKFPAVKKIEIGSCENIAEEIIAELKKIVTQNTKKISQLASKIEEIKDETKKEEFTTELTRIKKMSAQNYSPDEVATSLNILEQDIQVQKQKETEEAKPHRQTYQSSEIEATQLTPATSSNDLIWELKCENCLYNNSVYCSGLNGGLFTMSDCRKYQKEAKALDLKCKCSLSN